MDFLSMVRIELENMDANALTEPKIDVQCGERQVGVLTDRLSRLYTLTQIYRRLHADKLHAVMICEGPVDGMLQYEIQLIQKQLFILSEIFWMDVRSEYDIKLEPSIGLRIGWKVVVNDNHEA